MIFVLYSFLILEISPITHVVPSNCLVPLETFLSFGWCLQKMIWGQFIWQQSFLLVSVFENYFSFGQFWLVWQLAALLLTNLTRDWVEKHHRVDSLLILLTSPVKKTLPKALRTQASTALTSNFGLVGLVVSLVG